MKLLLDSLRGMLDWFEQRTGLIKPIMEHPVPKSRKWAYVFGSATLFSFLLQIATGVILATMYVPSTDSAFQSLSHIQNVAFTGKVVRGMHYFGASAMFMFMFIGIHMLRVFFICRLQISARGELAFGRDATDPDARNGFYRSVDALGSRCSLVRQHRGKTVGQTPRHRRLDVTLRLRRRSSQRHYAYAFF